MLGTVPEAERQELLSPLGQQVFSGNLHSPEDKTQTLLAKLRQFRGRNEGQCRVEAIAQLLGVRLGLLEYGEGLEQRKATESSRAKM